MDVLVSTHCEEVGSPTLVPPRCYILIECMTINCLSKG